METAEFRLENGSVVLSLNYCFPCKTTWLKKILRLYNAKKNNLVAIETMIDYVSRELLYYQEQLEYLKHKESTKTQLKEYERIVKNSKEQLDILKGYLQ